jgi:hypothetical protein
MDCAIDPRFCDAVAGEGSARLQHSNLWIE